MTLLKEQFSEVVKVTLSERQQIENNQTDGNIQGMDESAKSQEFFQDNNPLRKKYTTTWIKSRNFLSNIAYVGINKEDFYNENFTFDVYLLVTKNLNPFCQDRKLAGTWSTCSGKNARHKSSTNISAKKRNFCKKKLLYLSKKNFLQPKVLEIIIDFLKEDEKNSKYFLHNNLSSWKNIFQYVYYSNVFPEIYCSTEWCGFDLKSNFHINFIPSQFWKVHTELSFLIFNSRCWKIWFICP